ncbi:MAG: Crp/Fnr family transcriptional regulator [Chromatiales bacterium]|nr:Crp/Fnr family transcriptional regulator [Chromatiales bacterium]
MRSEAILHTLSRWPLFSELGGEQLQHLSGASRVRDFDRDAFLFRKGDRLTDFFCIVDGLVALVISTPDGAEKIVNIEESGHTFGEALLFLDQPSPIAARTLEPSRLLMIPRAVVMDTIQDSHQFTRQLLAGLSARLHHLVMDLESYCLRSSTQRVVDYLISEAQLCESNRNAAELLLPVAKGVLASRLKLTPETLSRVLHELVADGLISVSGKVIRILDLRRLREAR